MPQHSSNKYYKAEQEEFERNAWDKWVNNSYDRYWWFEDYCDVVYYMEYYKEHYHYGNDYVWEKKCACCSRCLIDCKYYCKDSSCDLCYEYITETNRKELIEDHFTPNEILFTLQEHLRVKNCWCYDKLRSNIALRRVNKLIRARRSSLQCFIPDVYDPTHIPPCIIQILDKRLGEEVKVLHDIKVNNEKTNLLEKYGLTLEDYKKFRIERPDICSQPVEKVEPAKPKQKFIKVKESLLKEGSF